MEHISAPELYALIQHNNLDGIIVDVRTPEEYTRGHIQGAKNIPLDTIVGETSTLAKEPKVYLYCLSGGRSSEAQSILAEAGLTNTVNLVSGLLAWRVHQLPLAQ